MQMKLIKGDALRYLLECDGPAVCAHQVNCLGIMGAGFARQVKTLFPEVFKYYAATCKRESVEYKNLMGNAQLCLLDRYNDRYICNLFGQLGIGKGTNERKTNYAHLASSLLLMQELLEGERLLDANIIFPYGMSSDRGGANWEFVSELITDVFPNAIFVQLTDRAPAAH